jgi:hypothetical protein
MKKTEAEPKYHRKIKRNNTKRLRKGPMREVEKAMKTVENMKIAFPENRKRKRNDRAMHLLVDNSAKLCSWLRS